MSEEIARQLMAEYTVNLDLRVAWGEMDAYQHVNNTVYLRYFENGRIAYFEQIGMLEERAATGIGPILASVNCRFRFPLTYPDTVTVGVSIQEIHSDRFTIRHAVASHRFGRVAAQGESVVVMYNYEEAQKALVSAELRRKIEILEGR